MKKRILFISLAVVLALSVGLIGCDGGNGEPPTDKIYMFAARSLSGPLETIGDFAFGPVMDYWQDGVNSAGGIAVGGAIGTKLVDLTIVDDTSDMGTMSGLLSSAIASNDYHFMLPPCSTSFLQSAAGICSGSGYVLIGAEGGCTSIQNSLDTPEYSYLFATLTFSTWNQMEELFKILRDWQTGTENAQDPMDCYIMYIGDLHGFEYRDAFIAEAALPANTGHFNVVGTASVALDAVSVLTQLNAAAAANATLLASFTYPPASMLTVSESIDNNINFPAMIVGPGVNFEFMLIPAVGGVTCNLDMEGVMGFTTFNEASGGNVTQAFVDDFVTFFNNATATVAGTSPPRPVNGAGMGRFILDWWGAMPYVAGLEILQAAIEETNSLDNDTLRTELSTRSSGDPFTTTFGPAWFVNPETGLAPGANSGGLLCKDFYHGQIGQWQYDPDKFVIPEGYWPAMNCTGDEYPGWMIYEVIDVGTGTADGIYPKPDWGDWPADPTP